MNYEEAVAYILDVPKFTKKNTLDNTRAVLERLGRPDRRCRLGSPRGGGLKTLPSIIP